MVGFVVRRLLATLVILGLISVVTFAVFWTGPRRPAREFCNYNCTTASIEELNRTHGYDRPMLVQYADYMSGLIDPRGRELGSEGSRVHCAWPCFDRSIHSGEQVWPMIAASIMPTMWLALGGAVLWLVGGVFLGVQAALRRGRKLDRLSVALALIGASFPALVFGNILLYVVVVWLKLLPYPEMHNASLTGAGPKAWFKFYLLPWITLALVNAALYTRLTRASMIDTMAEDFIRTARAKGLTERRVVYRHGLRVAVLPIVTTFGLDLGTLLGGAVITEQIFSIYGLGRLTIDSLLGTDLPVIMAVTLLGAFFIVIANLVVDVVQAALDPRIRLTGR